MKLYDKGRRLEYKARKELEEAGYYVIRSASSKGAFDLVAINWMEVKLIQCKTEFSGVVIKQLREISVPQASVSKELWIWKNREWVKYIV